MTLFAHDLPKVSPRGNNSYGAMYLRYSPDGATFMLSNAAWRALGKPSHVRIYGDTNNPSTIAFRAFPETEEKAIAIHPDNHANAEIGSHGFSRRALATLYNLSAGKHPSFRVPLTVEDTAAGPLVTGFIPASRMRGNDTNGSGRI